MGSLPINNKHLSINEAAKHLGVSTKTLRRWEASGTLLSLRTQGGHRRYSISDLNAVKNKSNRKPRKIYVRHIPETPAIKNSIPKPITNTFPAYAPIYNSPALAYEQKKALKVVFYSIFSFLLLLTVYKSSNDLLLKFNRGKQITTGFIQHMSLPLPPIAKSFLDSYYVKQPQIALKQNPSQNVQVLAAETTLPQLSINIGSTFNEVANFVKGLTASDVSTGTLEATGPSTFGNTVTINGVTTITGATNIVGATNITGALKETGNSTFTGNADISGDLTSPSTTFNLLNTGVTTLNIGNASTNTSISATTGTTTINNDFVNKGTLTSSGKITGSGDLAITGATALTGTLKATGATTLSSLDTSGNATFGNITKVNGVTYSFPTSGAAASNYVLSSDTSGNLTWQSVSAAGGVVSGSGAANQVTFWNSSSTISGSSSFTWNNSTTTLNVGGTLTGATIAAGSNTITGLTNANLSGSAGITNANLANSSLTINSAGILTGGGSVSLGSALTLTATEADTLATVTGRGATSATALTLSNAANSITAGTLTATGGTINGTSIGATSPSTGAFSTLSASSTVNFAGLSVSSAVYTDGSKNLTSTAPSTGILGFWNRSGTTLSPATAGDAITTSGNISTSGSGTITSAGLLTGSAGLTVSGATANINVAGTSSTAIGNSTGTFALISSGGLNVTTIGGLTGVATLDTITTSATALGFAGTGSLTSGSGTNLNITPGTTGVLNLATTNTGNVAVGNSTGTFALTSSGGLNVSTGGGLTGVATLDTITTSATALTFAGAGTVDTSGTSTLNLGTGTGGKIINIGTDDTTADTIAIGSAKDTTTILGTNLNLNNSGGGATNIGTNTNSGTITIGRTTNTDLALNDAQWNITGAGAANFASIGAGTRGTGAFTTLDANSTVTLSGLSPSTGNGLCVDGSNHVVTCTVGSGGISGSGTAGQIAFFSTGSNIVSESSGFGWDTSTKRFTLTSTDTTGTSAALSNTSLTTGKLFSATGTNTATTNTAITQNLFDVTNAQSTNANTNFNGLALNFTNNPSIAGNTENAARIQNQTTSNITDNAVASLLLLDNADTSGTGSTVVTDALRITNSGAIAAGITNGINFGSTTIDTGINFSSTPTTNYISGTNFSVTAAGAETLGSNLTVKGTTFAIGNGSAATINTPSGNANLTIAPNGSGILNLATTNTGNVAIGNSTGNFALTSSGGLNVSTGGGLTGVATLDTITTSATALGFAGTGSLTTGAGTNLNITPGTTGALNLATTNTGNVAVGNSTGTFALTSSGGLNVTTTGGLTGVSTLDTIATSATGLTFAGAGTISSTTTSALTLDSGTTGNVNLGTGANAKTVAIGNSTGATALTLTSGTGSQTFASSVATTTGSSSAFVFTSNSLTSGEGSYFNSSSLTTGNLVDINTGAANTLTTGNLLKVASTATSLTSGQLGLFDWSPGSSTTATGDLLSVNIGANGLTTGNIFNVKNNGSSVFGVSQNQITAALPTQFTAAGDVSIAYDIQFTNPVASFIKSNAPIYIASGETFNSSNLTLRSYNLGNILLDSGSSSTGTGKVGIGPNVTPLGLLHVSNTGENSAGLIGKALAIFDQGESQDILTASAAGTTKFAVDVSGNVYIGSNASGAANTALCYNSTSLNGATVYKIQDCPGTPADIAEWYAASPDVKPGDAVAVSQQEFNYEAKGADPYTNQVASLGTRTVNILKKAQPGDRVVGIISTGPFQTFGEDIKEAVDKSGRNDIKALPMALAGRIPATINTASSDILGGDRLTLGVTGDLVKAQNTGSTIATALESWNKSANKTQIMVILDKDYYIDPSTVINNATPSAQLADASDSAAFDTRLMALESAITASSSGMIANLSEVDTSKLNVLGDAVLGDTVVNGKLNVGGLTLDNINQSVNAIGVFKIQDLALGNVEFMNGLVVIDTKGNVTAKSITANKYNVAGTSAGTSTLNAGQTSVVINTNQVTSNSLIFVTTQTKTDKVLSVTQKTNGTNFKVEANSADNKDLQFSWWIVDKQ
jgi:excisionase family DNA binding protein